MPVPAPNELAKICFILYQFSTVRRYTEGTVGLNTTSMTGPSRRKILAVLLSVGKPL